ncbi:MAG: SDR family oxidoreductase [Tepidisphaeraceae bacterium]
MIDLKGRRALVGGSTQGIGRACAMELARYGADVTLAARDENGLKEVHAALPRNHGQTHGLIRVDFAEPQSLRREVDEFVAEAGPVHILINNTGGPPAGAALDAAPEDFLRAMTQHLLAGQMLVQATVPGMKTASYGRIINIISSSVVMPIRGLGVSNTVRGAMANWARTLAGELAPFGITVNNILPGYTATARLAKLIEGRAQRANSTPKQIERDLMASIPIGRFATPEEIASVVTFLASPAASYVNGVNLPVDGGRLAVQ